MQEILSCVKEQKDTSYHPLLHRQFKRIVAELDTIENIGIATLNRAGEDDHQLNELLDKITKEIKYPLVTPVVTTLSQQYFCIYPGLNLLCIPLAEGKFLLHLPDLYHELAHPIFCTKNDPLIEPLQHQHMMATREVLSYTSTQKHKESRRRSPESFYEYLCLWEALWIKFWLEEFFCDLFGIYTLGVAFAWSHLHLVIKRGGDPFEVPLLRPISHPCDNARLKVMLYGLENLGFQQQVKSIREYWKAFLSQINAKPEPEYYRCYPDDLLKTIAEYALLGVKELQCRVATPNTNDVVHDILNEAWTQFWKNPTNYIQWEKQAVSQLLDKS